MTDTVERIDMIHERVNLRKDNPEIVLDTYVCRDLEGTAPCSCFRAAVIAFAPITRASISRFHTSPRE